MEYSLNQIINKSLEQNKCKIAVRNEQHDYSYEELAELINTINSRLDECVCEGNKKILLLLYNSIELIASIITSLKRGLVFIPINPDLPLAKLTNYIDSIDPAYIVTSRKSNNIIYKLNMITKVFSINENELNMNIHICNSKVNDEKGDETDCYIYFSSGSTGEPKGVVGNKNSLAQFILWEINEFNLKGGFVFSQLTPPTFDPFLRDILVPICSGGTICIPNRNIFRDIRQLIKWIQNSKIEIMHTVPSLFRSIIYFCNENERFDDLKYILLAGEMLYGNDILKFFEKCDNDIQLVNLYGPTETTLAKFYYKIKRNDANHEQMPVGQPIDPSTKAYIFDDGMNEIPNNGIGEIYISTKYMSNGYFRNEALTGNKFIANNYDGNELIYRTNDLGKIDEEGRLIITGRLDNLIKIRGIQVYPEEVEKAMMEYALILNAVVFTIDNIENEKTLCSCIEVKNDIKISHLKNYLSTKLPNYMIPTNILILTAIPKTASGKNDRKASIEFFKDFKKNKDELTIGDPIKQEFIDYYEKYINNLFIDESVDFDESLELIGFSSLNYVQFIVMLEEKYKIEFPIECLNINSFNNLNQLLEYIKTRAKDEK